MSKKVKIKPIVYPIYLNTKYSDLLLLRLKELKEALPNLIKLQEKVKDKPYFSRSGVCKNITGIAGANYLNCSHVYSEYWPKYNGNMRWPISSGRKNTTAYHAFYNFHKWSICTQYGRDRHEYLQFLIDIIKGELEYAKEHNL